MPYVCPHCHKQVKELKRHIATMHPEKVETPVINKDELSTSYSQLKPKVTGKVLELKVEKPQKPETKAEPPGKGYHCVDCGYSGLKRGQNPCPQCGTQLDWSKV